MFPYTTLSFYGVFCNISLLIPDSANLGGLFFPLVNWSKSKSVNFVSHLNKTK